MKFLGNLVWFLFGGLWMGLGWTLVGLLWCVTEKQTREELDQTVSIVKEVLGIWN